jgi:hypothetical protein
VQCRSALQRVQHSTACILSAVSQQAAHHSRCPKTFQPTANATRNVEKARKDPKTNARIVTAIERWTAPQLQSARQNDASLRIDDSNPPTNINTIVTSTGLSLNYDVHEVQDVRNDDGHDIHDVSDGHDCYDTHDNDSTIAIDARAELLGTLSTMAVDDTTHNDLLNR